MVKADMGSLLNQSVAQSYIGDMAGLDQDTSIKRIRHEESYNILVSQNI